VPLPQVGGNTPAMPGAGFHPGKARTGQRCEARCWGQSSHSAGACLGGATLPDRVDRLDAQGRWAPWARQASSEPVASEGSHLLLDYSRQPEGTPWPQAQDRTFGPAADEVQKNI